MFFTSVNDYKYWKEEQELFNQRMSSFIPTNIQMQVQKAFVPFQNTVYRAASTWIGDNTFRDNQCYVLLSGKYAKVYPMTEDQYLRWMSSNSLGRYFNQNIRGR